MELLLYLFTGLTPVIQLYVRATGSASGGPITGTETVTSGLYTFSLAGKADGDYNVQLTGVSTPDGPLFCIRILDGVVYSAGSWSEMSFIAPNVDVPESEPTFVTGFWKVYTKAGLLDPDITIYLRIEQFPESHTGVVMEDSMRETTSDEDGIATFANLFPGATYSVWKAGSARKYFVTVPSTATETVALGSLVG